MRPDGLSYHAERVIIAGMDDGQHQPGLRGRLFHPIRWFRGDLAANPLSRFIWGIEPKNRARRRRSRAAVWFPSCLYLALLLTVLFAAAPLLGGATIREAMDFGALASLMMVSTFLAAMIWAPSILLIRVFNMTPARRLDANWADYHLAGIGGRQMLWAMAGPGAIGMAVALLIFGLAFGAASVLLFVNRVLLEPAGSEIWLMFVFGLAPAFALLIGALLDIALWVILPSFLARLCTVGLLSVVTSPVLMFYFVGLVLRSTPANTDPFVIAQIEVASWPFRIWFAVWMLRRALRRLEVK